MSRFARQRGARFTLWASFIATRCPLSDRDADRVGNTQIWIGSACAAMNDEFLQENNIRYTLTVAKGLVDITNATTTTNGDDSQIPSGVDHVQNTTDNIRKQSLTQSSPQAFASEVERAVLPMKDDGSETLVSDTNDDLTKALDFIDEALRSGSGILVHCERGISRSTTIVCAYLIMRRGMTFEDALVLIRESRPHVKPNLSFGLQLKKLEGQSRSMSPVPDQDEH